MELSLTVFVCCFVAAAVASPQLTPAQLWQKYQQDFNKTYASDVDSQYGYHCFLKNNEKINKLNADRKYSWEAKHGWNEFTDMCETDFKIYHSLKISANRTLGKNWAPTLSKEEVDRLTASSADWRKKGVVTPIKNQGQCGSCWSFSSTGNMEGQHAIATGRLIAFSEEELVQCSHNGNNGCQGGIMDDAFAWVTSNGGIDTEANYPYTSGGGYTGSCDSSKLGNKAASFSSHLNVAHDEGQMAAWVAKNGPLSIAVDAAQGWQSYAGGIMRNCYGRQLDHGVLIVGFGESQGTPYWIVKNSWGPGWGDSGYIYLERGTDQCGITGSPCSSVSGASPPGPAPAPGPAPPPPGPAPQCTSATEFEQFDCRTDTCQEECTHQYFPTRECFSLAGGGSGKACCTTEGTVYTYEYEGSGCEGEPAAVHNYPTRECMRGEDYYWGLECPS